MAATEHIFNPYYNKRRGMTLGFLISTIFCTKIEKFERQVIFLMYIANAIDHNTLKYNRNQLTKEFLLQRIFELSANKKYVSKSELRQLVDIEDKVTFNKYYDRHLLELGLKTNRMFTLYELYKFLEINQGSHDWSRMSVYSKGELANEYMNGNYDNLELEMTNTIFDFDTYKNHDFIFPSNADLFIKTKTSKMDCAAEFEEDRLSFFFYAFLLYSIKSQNNHRINN